MSRSIDINGRQSAQHEHSWEIYQCLNPLRQLNDHSRQPSHNAGDEGDNDTTDKTVVAGLVVRPRILHHPKDVTLE